MSGDRSVAPDAYQMFKDRVDEWIRTIKGSKLQAGSDEVLLPGDRALEEEKSRLKNGVPIRPDQWAKLSEMAVTAGIDLDTLRAKSARL